MRRDTSPEEMSWALIDFAAWCVESKEDLASTISGNFAAVQKYHRVEVSRDHRNISVNQMCAEGYRKVVEADTHYRVRLPVTWRMLLDG